MIVLVALALTQDGEVVNKIEGFECENRRVLHTAMRDVFDSPNQVLAWVSSSSCSLSLTGTLGSWRGDSQAS